MGHDFTSRSKQLGSMFDTAVYKIQARKRNTLSPYHWEKDTVDLEILVI